MGGGSGGSVFIQANRIIGVNNSIQVLGGNSTKYDEVGKGSGGRIRIDSFTSTKEYKNVYDGPVFSEIKTE